MSDNRSAVHRLGWVEPTGDADWLVDSSENKKGLAKGKGFGRGRIEHGITPGGCSDLTQESRGNEHCWQPPQRHQNRYLRILAPNFSVCCLS